MRFVSESCELKCSFVLLITKGQRKVLEAVKGVTFPSCQCPVWPRAPLGKLSFVYPRPAPPKHALPCLRWGLLCTHTFVSCHTSISTGWPLCTWPSTPCPCRPGFQLWGHGGHGVKVVSWISVSIKIRSLHRLPVMNVHYLLFLMPRALCRAALNHTDRFLFIFCIMWAW